MVPELPFSPGGEICGESMRAECTSLLQNSHLHKPEKLLVVGTAQHYGEDCPCTGRLLLFSIRLQPGEGGREEWEAELLCQRCAVKS